VDTLILATIPKVAAQVIRKSSDMGWAPERYVGSPGGTAAKAVSPDKGKGMITDFFGKDPNDPRWADDPEYKEWAAFAGEYMTPNDVGDALALYGFSAADLMVHVLKQCGDDLSRDNIMRQAASIKDYHVPMSLPGATINTSPTDYRVGRQLQLARFNGMSWEWFGDLLSD
jgi:branched-chain amino acid transport system substrate-binding protein